jgi:hypothetical protein
MNNIHLVDDVYPDLSDQVSIPPSERIVGQYMPHGSSTHSPLPMLVRPPMPRQLPAESNFPKVPGTTGYKAQASQLPPQIRSTDYDQVLPPPGVPIHSQPETQQDDQNWPGNFCFLGSDEKWYLVPDLCLESMDFFQKGSASSLHGKFSIAKSPDKVYGLSKIPEGDDGEISDPEMDAPGEPRIQLEGVSFMVPKNTDRFLVRDTVLWNMSPNDYMGKDDSDIGSLGYLRRNYDWLDGHLHTKGPGPTQKLISPMGVCRDDRMEKDMTNMFNVWYSIPNSAKHDHFGPRNPEMGSSSNYTHFPIFFVLQEGAGTFNIKWTYMFGFLKKFEYLIEGVYIGRNGRNGKFQCRQLQKDGGEYSNKARVVFSPPGDWQDRNPGEALYCPEFDIKLSFDYIRGSVIRKERLVIPEEPLVIPEERPQNRPRQRDNFVPLKKDKQVDPDLCCFGMYHRKDSFCTILIKTLCGLIFCPIFIPFYLIYLC